MVPAPTRPGALLYSVTMSLDGYIAGPGGDMSWLGDHLEGGPEVDALSDSVGSMLVGHRTFCGDDPNAGTDEEGAFSGTWHGPVVVLSHESAPDGLPDDTRFTDDLGAGIALARERAGGRYVNVLGADVARQCLALGQLDEVLVLVAPVLLGDGTRLLHEPGGVDVRLEPRLPGDTGPLWHWYRVVR